MNTKPTERERAHLQRVKALPCSVCNAPGPSDAHHIEQALQYAVVALCKDCHQGSHNGIHGQRAMWRVMKLSELGALNTTIKRLMEANQP